MRIVAVITWIIGLTAFAIMCSAGVRLCFCGSELTTLRSVGGTSVAEAYYQSIGQYGIGYGLVAYSLAFGIAMLSLALGGILWKMAGKATITLKKEG